ncbi:hopanoid-associated sugar epimerase [Candidatus Uabimicrobium amorphum]|uniref:Dihydroflavonol-4-reductase n=1 Tax=Uabimicrobium amorphum TaxID=2596890 RepID=A0A5S9IM97_UABAM|nr:hopanoid-associated sugar epimerase [Candidatus Uabimicrobium amorphum]BBM84046.1 dihydroflavonol-4-reductase [Candidatus Uabimicrobium amorphum]
MKALVTGASGFVGYSVAKALIAEGIPVKLLLRSEPQQHVQNLGVEICRGDLCDEESLKTALRDCRYVFHVAAHYTLWEKDPSIFYKVNVEGSKKLIELAHQAGVEKIVYTSSVATLKLAKDRSAVNEESIADITDMVGEYKKSKFLAEIEVKKLADKGIPVTIVSPSTPIGAYDVKPTPTGKIIVDFLQRKMPAYLDTGLNFVDVADVARGHILALHKGEIGEVYILGGKNLTLIEMLQILETITSLKAPKVKMPYVVAYTAALLSQTAFSFIGKTPPIPLDGVKMARKYMFFDSNKAQQKLGYTITPIEKALEEAVEWFYDNNYAKRPTSS